MSEAWDPMAIISLAKVSADLVSNAYFALDDADVAN
jgi:hypothetical protein